VSGSGDTAICLTQCHQCRGETEWITGKVDGVDGVVHPVGPPLPKVLRHLGHSRIPRGIDPTRTDQDRLEYAFTFEAARRRLHPWIGTLGQKDPGTAALGAFHQLLAERHWAKRRRSASATAG
jgi:hypothetical protein